MRTLRDWYLSHLENNDDRRTLRDWYLSHLENNDDGLGHISTIANHDGALGFVLTGGSLCEQT